MAAKKSGLGKGLDTLIPNKVNAKQTTTTTAPAKTEGKAEIMVKLSKVEPNKSQPRKDFDEKSLQELADSIKAHGVIQPLIVQDRKDYYEIIAGERRWRAAKLAGLKEIPVIIKNLSDQEIMEVALIENIQRENLNPIEEALAFRQLLDEYHLKQDDLAKRVSKSRTAITNSVRLLKLPENIQKYVINGKLSTGHARALLAVADTEMQTAAAKQIIEEGLSVRQTEQLIKKLTTKKPQKKTQKKDTTQLDLVYANIAEQIQEALGSKVSICPKSKEAGKIEISYFSQDELERILFVLKPR